MKKNLFASRRFKHGSLATIITVGFIVLVILINVVATMLLERFPLSIDLTKDNRFEITQESIDYTKKIDTEVTISICADEAALERSIDTKQALEIIKSYAKHNGKISIDFIDLTKDPNFAKKYPNETFRSGDIFIDTDMRTKKISINDLFTQMQNQQTGETKVSSKAEQVMTGALMYVTDKEPTTVSILSGMDSVDVTGYKSLLVSNNYNVLEQNLLTDEINKEAAFVILPQPSTDLTVEIVKKLDDYLDNDGKFDKSLIFVASPNTPVGPVLKNFLEQWGMAVGDETIVETDGAHAIQNAYLILSEVKDEDFKKALKSQQLPIVTGLARPIDVLWESSENRTTKVLTSSYDTSVLLPPDAKEDFDINAQEKNAYNTLVIGTRSKYEGTTLQASNVIVVSAATMISAEFLTMPSLSNGDATLAMTNLIAPKKETVRIVPVELNQEQITITTGQVFTNMIVFVIVIPILVLITGLVVWFRRRHL